jgi:hypothetical protein
MAQGTTPASPYYQNVRGLQDDEKLELIARLMKKKIH